MFSYYCWNSRYLNLLADGCLPLKLVARVCVSRKLSVIEVWMCNTSGTCSLVDQMFVTDVPVLFLCAARMNVLSAVW